MKQRNLLCSTAGVEESGTLRELKIYPNPGSGIVNLRIDEDLQGRLLEIELYDLTGKLI